MKRMSVREFGSEYSNGYKYTFELDNQTDDYRFRCQYITEDRRIFDRILIALNPDCVKFIDGTGSCLTIDGVDCIDIRKKKGDMDFYFDVVCDIPHLGKSVLTFLASKK